MAVSKRLRMEVLRRDGFRCKYCHSEDSALTIDHVIPTTLGGSDDPSNLVAACASCNSGKSASSPDQEIVADVAADAQRWAAAMRHVAQEVAAEREQRDDDQEWFYDEWHRYTDEQGCSPTLGPGWRTSVDAWRQAGLTRADFRDLVASVMARANVRDRFKYFCGTAWSAVRQRQERAQAYLAEQERCEDEADKHLPDEEGYDEAGWLVASMTVAAKRLEHVDTKYWSICRDGVETMHVPFTPCVPFSSLFRLIAEEAITAYGSEAAEEGVARGYATFCTYCCTFDPSRGTRALQAAGIVRVLEAA